MVTFLESQKLKSSWEHIQNCRPKVHPSPKSPFEVDAAVTGALSLSNLSLSPVFSLLESHNWIQPHMCHHPTFVSLTQWSVSPSRSLIPPFLPLSSHGMSGQDVIVKSHNNLVETSQTWEQAEEPCCFAHLLMTLQCDKTTHGCFTEENLCASRPRSARRQGEMRKKK